MNERDIYLITRTVLVAATMKNKCETTHNKQKGHRPAQTAVSVAVRVRVHPTRREGAFNNACLFYKFIMQHNNST